MTFCTNISHLNNIPPPYHSHLLALQEHVQAIISCSMFILAYISRGPLLNGMIYKHSMTENNELRKTEGHSLRTAQAFCASLRHRQPPFRVIHSDGPRLSHTPHG